MTTTSTLVDILRDVNRDLGPIIGQVPKQGTTTSAGAAGGTTAVDTGLILPDAGTGLFDGSFFRVDGTISGGPTSGEVRVVRKGGFAGATGTLTLGAGAATQVKSLTPYSIWRAIHPADALLFVQHAMRLLPVKQFYPWSLVTNPDFAAVTSGAGPDNWTATSLTQTTTAGYNSTNVRHGVYSARTLLSGSSGKLRSSTVDVTPGATYGASVAARAAVGTGILRLVDVTGGSALSGVPAPSWAGKQWVELEIPPFTMPTGIYQVAMELAGTNSADDISWDDAIFWKYTQRDYALPSWVEDPAYIESIGYFDRGRSLASYTFDLDEQDFKQIWTPPDEIDEIAAFPYRMRLDWADVAGYRPLYINGYKPATVLSADTDTTTVDRELLVKMTLYLICDAFAFAAQFAGKADEKNGWIERRESIGRDGRIAQALTRFGQRPLEAHGMRFSKS